jgi:uncharacterized protein YbjT (DUF2867 family)
MTILVTGATGRVGRIVLDRIREAGTPVRALTRDPVAARLPAGVQVAEGDLTRPSTLVRAFEGIRVLYLFPVPQTAVEVLRLARQAGVRRVVVLSSSAVTDGTDTTHHLPVEKAAERSGLAWTHVRPGEFALNKLTTWGRSIRGDRVVRSAHPDCVGVPVHEADVAAVAVAALLDERHAGAAYTVTGPQALTHREQAKAIGEGIGCDIRLEEVSVAQAHADLVSQGLPPQVADYVLAFEAKWTHDPPTVQPTVEQVTGAPGRTLAQWAADHTDDLL